MGLKMPMGLKILTNEYMSALCLEMSMLFSAGITAENALAILIDDEPDKDWKAVLQKLYDSLQGGISLSEAMKSSACFPLYMIRMVNIGEKTGRLTESLEALSEHYERQDRLAIAVKNATLYPAIMLAMMIVVVLVLIIQVLPIFNDVFGRMGAQMSPFALRLMAFGLWFRGAAIIISLISSLLFALIFFLWLRKDLRQRIASAFKNKWGGSGLLGRIATAEYVSSIRLAMASGLDIEDSISLAASLNNDSAVLYAKYEKCINLLRDGKRLSDALSATEILTARDGRMLALGTSSGKADSAMAEIARRRGISLQDEINAIVGRIEPTLVIITTAIVAVILLSVMLPLIGIMSSIG